MLSGYSGFGPELVGGCTEERDDEKELRISSAFRFFFFLKTINL